MFSHTRLSLSPRPRPGIEKDGRKSLNQGRILSVVAMSYNFTYLDAPAGFDDSTPRMPEFEPSIAGTICSAPLCHLNRDACLVPFCADSTAAVAPVSSHRPIPVR